MASGRGKTVVFRSTSWRPSEFDAAVQSVHDLEVARQSPLWLGAVDLVRSTLRIPYVRERIDNAGRTWLHEQHMALGMTVRHMLREHKMGEVEFGITNLDNIYMEIIEEACYL